MEQITQTQPHEASLAGGAPNGAATAPVAPSPPVAPPAPVAAPVGPLIANRYEWMPADENEEDWAVNFRAAYPGFKARIWVNYPQRLSDELTNTDEDGDERVRRRRDALKRMVRAHNDWRLQDEETGEVRVLPPPTTDAFWDDVPDELAGAVILMVHKAASRLPNSMVLLPRRNSRRG